jgi:hypothetical protein
MDSQIPIVPVDYQSSFMSRTLPAEPTSDCVAPILVAAPLNSGLGMQGRKILSKDQSRLFDFHSRRETALHCRM